MGLGRSVWEALLLIIRGDAEVWQITAVSLQVSVTALIAAAVVGIPLGHVLGNRRNAVAGFFSWVLYTLAAIPTVAIGLLFYFVFSASGPLGWTELLYTRAVMAFAQFTLALPILTAIALTSTRRLPNELRETAIVLGMGPLRRMWVLLWELRLAVISALLIAFARVFTELGAAIIVGGNIRGRTRTLTTVIALEHSKGDDARAIALGVVLVVIALAVSGLVHGLTERARSSR